MTFEDYENDNYMLVGILMYEILTLSQEIYGISRDYCINKTIVVNGKVFHMEVRNAYEGKINHVILKFKNKMTFGYIFPFMNKDLSILRYCRETTKKVGKQINIGDLISFLKDLRDNLFIEGEFKSKYKMTDMTFRF